MNLSEENQSDLIDILIDNLEEQFNTIFENE
jgi:hypothetical protein